MEHEEKKNLRIPAWKVWILIIAAVQAISAVQNYRVHQQMRDRILRTQSSLNRVLQNDVEYHQDLNHTLELILKNLQGQ